MDDKNKTNAKLVFEKLKLGKFFKDYSKQIYSELEEIEQNFSNKVSDNVRFVSECLTLISGVVHVGSTEEDYDKAIAWANKVYVSSDPGPIYALILIHIVENGYAEFKESKDEDKKKIWESIYNRVDATLSQ